MRKHFGGILYWAVTAATSLVAVLKGAIYLVGLSTVWDDATALPEKVRPMIGWLSTQPGLIIYGMPLGLAALGAWFSWGDGFLPRLLPRLSLTFDHSCVRDLAQTNSDAYPELAGQEAAGPPARFFRVLTSVTPGRVATGCVPYLRSVEYLEGAGFVPTKYAGTQQLRWAEITDGGWQEQAIDESRALFVDLLSVDPHYNAIKVKFREVTLYDESVFERLGTYRLVVTVRSANVGVGRITLLLHWNGVWNQTTMEAA